MLRWLVSEGTPVRVPTPQPRCVDCMFVDPIVVILILTPIFAPVAASAGVDPALVGAGGAMQDAIGSVPTPFSCDIFAAMATFRRPYMEIIRGMPPLFLILMCRSLLVILFPQMALSLRDLAFR